MFYMYNSFVAFKIPPLLQAEASLIPGGTSRKIGWGCAARFLKTLTLFQSKICAFPYPIPDLIKHLIPYFRPEALEPRA